MHFSVLEFIYDRNRYHTACVQHIRELNELGRPCCPFDGCRKENINAVPYFRHLQMHYEAQLSTTPTTPIDSPINVHTEPALQSDPSPPRSPRRSARIAAQWPTSFPASQLISWLKTPNRICSAGVAKHRCSLATMRMPTLKHEPRL